MTRPHPGLPRPRRAAAWIPGQQLAGSAETFERDAGTHGAADAPLVGVLALQGDVLEHLRALTRVGARAVRVRCTQDLDDLDGIVLPGGESTTIGILLERQGMMEQLRHRLIEGLPVFGTCAGLILLSRELDQQASQPLLGVLHVRTRRNAFGRQRASFDTSLTVKGLQGGALDVSFIRAPWIVEVGSPDIEVWAEVEGHPVIVRSGRILASAFHAELTGDDRLHAAFLDIIRGAR